MGNSTRKIPFLPQLPINWDWVNVRRFLSNVKSLLEKTVRTDELVLLGVESLDIDLSSFGSKGAVVAKSFSLVVDAERNAHLIGFSIDQNAQETIVGSNETGQAEKWPMSIFTNGVRRFRMNPDGGLEGFDADGVGPTGGSEGPGTMNLPGGYYVNGVPITTTLAPANATYITQTPNSTLSNEQALSLLSTGILKSTTTTGIVSIASSGTDYLAPNVAITPATKTKITYDAHGLVTSGTDAAFSDITGTAATTQGGTGLTTYTQGDVLYSDASNSLAKLAKSTSSTRYLSNTGTTNNPAWAQVDLTNGVSGDLPFASLVQASGASKLVGRGSASGAGDFQEITLDSSLTMSGTTLSATGSSGFVQYAEAKLTGGDVTTTSNTFADLTGSTVTLTTGAHRCIVSFMGNVTCASSVTAFVDILVDGTSVGGTQGVALVSLGAGFVAPIMYTFTTAVLSAASHTIKVQWHTQSSLSLTMKANTTTTPAWLMVTETGLTT